MADWCSGFVSWMDRFGVVSKKAALNWDTNKHVTKCCSYFHKIDLSADHLNNIICSAILHVVCQGEHTFYRCYIIPAKNYGILNFMFNIARSYQYIWNTSLLIYDITSNDYWRVGLF